MPSSLVDKRCMEMTAHGRPSIQRRSHPQGFPQATLGEGWRHSELS